MTFNFIIIVSTLYFVLTEVVFQLRSSVVPIEDAHSAQAAFGYFLAGALFIFAASQLIQSPCISRARYCLLLALPFHTPLVTLFGKTFSLLSDPQIWIGSTL